MRPFGLGLRKTIWPYRALIFAGAILLPCSVRGEVEVNVSHVGFPGIVPAGDVFRYGCWVPIMVDLALIGQAGFDGVVRIAQEDGDGDECSDSVEVHLRAETGGTQRVFLYVPASRTDRGDRFDIELRSTEGALVPVISEGQTKLRADPAAKENVIAIPHDDILVLSVSTGAAGRITDLADARPLYTRDINVAHIAPTDLPELAIGLEMVDFIVWEDAQPELLTKKQLAAVLDWVRHGGTLLIAAAESVGSLRLATDLEPLLPVVLGELMAVDNLPQVRERLLSELKREGDAPIRPLEWLDEPFSSKASVLRCSVRPGARVIAREESDSFASDVVTRRPEGRGHIIFSAITLRDLFSAPANSDPLFEKLFQLIELRENETPATAESLFDHVAAGVGFAASGTIYLLIAASFSIAYVAGATFGLWSYLGRRGWRKHSWTAFAVAGGVASVLSVMAVGAVRGIGDRLHQISVVDLNAGERRGEGTALFGLKTSVDKALDVWLPDDWIAAGKEPVDSPCFLRPIPPNSESTEMRTRFADPAEYRLLPSTGVIENVRARATLKRFEGRWLGPLSGTVNGRISAMGRQIRADSFVANELGVALRDCILLLPITEVAETRDDAIQGIPIGELPADGRKVFLTELPALTAEKPDIPLLITLQAQWGDKFRGYIPGMRQEYSLGRERDALRLASTVGDLEPTADRFGAMGPRTWSRDRVRNLDLRSHLFAGKAPTPGQPAEKGQLAIAPQPGIEGMAVLIGFAEDPGPMRLFTRPSGGEFHILEPERQNSWTMYRVRIPFTQGGPSGDTAAGGNS